MSNHDPYSDSSSRAVTHISSSLLWRPLSYEVPRDMPEVRAEWA